jgi:hypothetical protein
MERTIMTTARKLFVMSMIAAAALPLYAYDNTVTHPQLTIVATQKSVLYTDRSILVSLGLLPATNAAGQTIQTYSYRGRVGEVTSGTQPYSIAQLVGEGAFDEDIGSRALNHFFDPVNDRPLTILGKELGERSWRWTLEDAGPINGQNFSVADARAYLTQGLTYNDGSPANSDSVRGSNLGLMLLSLGHAVHHIQDMTQPQHVRNDEHLDTWSLWGLNPFYNPSKYESYTKARAKQIQPFADSATPVYPGSNDFVTARDFWFNGQNSGIAQRDNRDFVSQGTNFRIFLGQVSAGDYALPVPGAPAPYTPAQLFQIEQTPVPDEIKSLCGDPAVNCTMTMYPTATTDRASTLSIFDQDLQNKGVYVTYDDGDPTTPVYHTQRLFALNQFNFDTAHPVLIQRAVSYSAGIINHFFRGRLEVTPPSSGPYAVVDQSFGAGFTKIKCRVKNATLNEALSQGTLQAIAHFHRNGCYQADLSGEFRIDPNTGQLITPCPNYRSVESHIRLTAEQSISFDIGETKDMTFTFADSIPLDATDLTLEVYFRGTVGGEAQTFALGVADLSEPTFIAIMNATDVFELNGNAFYYPDDIINGIANPPFSIVDINGDQVYSVPPDVDVRGGDMRFDLYLNFELVGSIPTLPQGRFSRLAAIFDPNSAYVLTTAASGGGFFEADNWAFLPKVNQIDVDGGFYSVDVVDYLRSQTLQFDSVGYYRYYPFPGADIDLMPPSKADNATAPVGIDMQAMNAPTAAPMSAQKPAPAAAEPPVSVAPVDSHEQLPVMQGGNKPVKRGKGKRGG